MARRTEVVSITFSDETTRRFKITQIKVKDAHAVMERLARIITPTLGNAASGLGATGLEAAIGDLSGKGIADASTAFASSLRDGDLDWFSEKLRAGIEIETETEELYVGLKGQAFEDAFVGEYAAELMLYWEALRVNFGSFSKAVGGLAGLARRFVTPSASSSPAEPSPGSGASS